MGDSSPPPSVGRHAGGTFVGVVVVGLCLALFQILVVWTFFTKPIGAG